MDSVRWLKCTNVFLNSRSESILFACLSSTEADGGFYSWLTWEGFRPVAGQQTPSLRVGHLAAFRAPEGSDMWVQGTQRKTVVRLLGGGWHGGHSLFFSGLSSTQVTDIEICFFLTLEIPRINSDWGARVITEQPLGPLRIRKWM
jgi:hypothetical protein